MDLCLYQELIDELQTAKAVLFVTFDRFLQKNGFWTLGVRRAGRHIDAGKVANEIGKCASLGFCSGGGHPHAAGAQCADIEVSAQAVCSELESICTALLGV